jgi:hypothetical protein
MIPLIGYLLCVYLVYKGIEIFQLGITRPDPSKKNPLVLGIVALIFSVVFALMFGFAFTVAQLPAL